MLAKVYSIANVETITLFSSKELGLVIIIPYSVFLSYSLTFNKYDFSVLGISEGVICERQDLIVLQHK